MSICDITNILDKFEIIAAIQLDIGRSDHHDDARPIDETVAPRLVSHLSGHFGQENVMLFVVHQQLRAVIYEHAPLTVHQQLTGITITCLHGYAFKGILTGIAAHTINGGYPQVSLFIAKQTLDLIIGQTYRVESTEILMIFVTIVAVQSAEGSYPQLAGLILGNTLHTSV